MFSSAHRLRFLPSDRVMDIYKKVKGVCCDSMELEFFAMNLEDQFGLDIETNWHEQVTLGEIFASVVAADRGAAAT